MPEALTITVDSEEVRQALANAASPAAARTVLEAAGEAVQAGAEKHFRNREAEPENTAGFPKFDESWGKRHFWADVRRQVRAPRWEADGSAVVEIDSPALAHKANPSPPRITPKGGRKYLAIPANARAAQWEGMPRDFNVAGGMTFGYSRTPEGRWMPALVAREHNTRTVKRGARAGSRVAAGADKASSGQGEPQFWLVRGVQTRHDPKAMPDAAALTEAAQRRAERALPRALGMQDAQNPGDR